MQTLTLVFFSSSYQWHNNAERDIAKWNIRFHWNNYSWLLLDLLFCYGHLLLILTVWMVPCCSFLLLCQIISFLIQNHIQPYIMLVAVQRLNFWGHSTLFDCSIWTIWKPISKQKTELIIQVCLRDWITVMVWQTVVKKTLCKSCFSITVWHLHWNKCWFNSSPMKYLLHVYHILVTAYHIQNI